MKGRKGGLGKNYLKYCKHFKKNIIWQEKNKLVGGCVLTTLTPQFNTVGYIGRPSPPLGLITEQ